MHLHENPGPPPAAPPPAPRPSRLQGLVERVHPVVWPVSLGAVGLAGALLLHVLDPNEPGNYPTCPWLLLTGTFCPGCGTMRAVALTTNLDILGAISMNPLLFVLAPYLLLSYARWFADALGFRRGPRRLTPTWFIWGLLVLILVYWVARNLPWFSFLAPGTPLFPGW
ncbi:DUF2752 domain-containing protein [Nocardiopsis dassonvillei]|uniref:DUF2752 domain-containing protein n=1 Tax=Nocardiopsis dassonvillei TaxID=2014 RepID=UPI0009F90A0F